MRDKKNRFWRGWPGWLKEAGWTIYEISVTLMLIEAGAMITINLATGRKFFLIVDAVLAFIVAIASVLLHRLRRKTIEILKEMQATQTTELLQLRQECYQTRVRITALNQIALSSIALKICHERGLPLDRAFMALDRDLSQVNPTAEWQSEDSAPK